jgi:deoxyadenosine/deoxycytidine kinase
MSLNPHYIAIEGPIGVGKTTLAHRLADSLDFNLLLEAPEENPFLGAFYDDRRAYALQAQLFFLLQRARQVDSLRQKQLFAGGWVTDFMFEKDPMFAALNLSGPEMKLYEDIYQRLAWQAPVPDCVIYLYAPIERLLERVELRGRPQEQHMQRDYLLRVAESYAEYFSRYDAAPLIRVNADALDLVGSERDYARLLEALASTERLIDLPAL